MPAVEGVGRDQYPKLRELGMKPAIVSGGHGFKKGPFNRDNRAFCIEKLKLTETEYLEALNKATNGGLVEAAWN